MRILLAVTSCLVAAAPAAVSACLIYVSPEPGSRGVSPHNNIILRSSEVLDASSTELTSVRVVGSTSGSHTGSLKLSDDRATLVFVPGRPFHLGEKVVVSVSASPCRSQGRSDFRFEFQVAERWSVGHQRPTEVLEQTDASWHTPNAARAATLAGPLPTDYPEIFIPWSDDPEPGLLFMAPRSTAMSAGPEGHLIVIDNRGQPLFYRRTPNRGTDFQVQQGLLTYFDGLFEGYYVMDSSYAVVDSFRMGNGYTTDFHDFRLMPNGHALMMAYDRQPVRMDSVVVGGDSNAVVIGLVLQELDTDKNVVFQWRSFDHFQITDAVECVANLLAATVDYVHGNSMEVDNDDNLIISNRHMNEITKIDRTTGDIIWRFGGNAVNNEFTILGDPRGFSHQHDARRLPNGHLTLFDNGNCMDPLYSRALEFELDETNKVATLVWEYRDTPDIYGLGTGNVQRRESGGTMINWGFGAKVTDLHADDSKALEVTFGPTFRTYRAFRFPWTTNQFSLDPPTLDFGEVATNDSAVLPLTIHNHRSEELEIDGLVVSDSIAYFPMDPGPIVVPPLGSVAVDIGFRPHHPTTFPATLYARAVNDTELVAQSVELIGSGIGPAEVFDPGGTRFGFTAVGPNPGPGRIRIGFALPRPSPIRLDVLDVQGRVVSELIHGPMPAGRHEQSWSGGPAAGLYFIRLAGEGGTATRRIVWMP